MSKAAILDSADFAQLTQVPWLDWALRKNRIGSTLQRTFDVHTSLEILVFLGKVIRKKQRAMSSGEYKDTSD